MKVKELIEMLSDHDPEDVVMIEVESSPHGWGVLREVGDTIMARIDPKTGKVLEGVGGNPCIILEPE